MAKRRRQTKAKAPLPEGTAPVGPREPCPCGSGERYKNCHGRAERASVGVRNPRPFAGLPFERDLVALREFVPAATAPVKLAPGNPTGVADARICSMLPMAWPALQRPDGELWLGLQLQRPMSLDPARDLVAAARAAAAIEPGSSVEEVPDWADDDPSPADFFAADRPLDITVHDDFAWWSAGDEPDGEVAASMERANGLAHPTAKLAGVEAAYWCQIGDRFHVRWVTDFAEERLLAGLSRLQAAGAATVGAGSKLVGSFRTQGLVVPVWDLANDTQPDEVEEPMAALAKRLDDAMADDSELTSEERRALNLLNSRQVTLHRR